MKTIVDYGTRFALLGFLLVTILVTIFDVDLKTATNQALKRAPGLATSAAVLLPTADVKITATRVVGETLKLVTPLPVNVVGPGGSSSGPAVLPDCATAPTNTACAWVNGTPTPEPLAATPQIYVGCGDEFYSCEDMTAMALAPAATTDAFLANTPIVQPEMQDAYRQACISTPKQDRAGLLAAICDGAGL